MPDDKKDGDPLKECPICGSEVEGDAEYCTECGNDFTPGKKNVY